jgi:signal recognition particle subunit SRP54
MADTFKSMAKDGGRSFARMAQMMGMGGAAAPGGPAIPPGLGGSMPDLEQLKALGGGKMPDLSQLSKLTGGPGGLPGLGNLPPGFNPFKKN